MFKLDFRIWDEVKEKMIHSVDAEVDKEKIIFWFNKTNNDLDIEEMMVFSGLKDDAGIKIYDGDIVKVHNERESENPYISAVTVDLINGTTITPHPRLQKMGINYPVPLIDYINTQKATSCIKIGNICTYAHLLDQIDEELENVMNDDKIDPRIEMYYGKHERYQKRYENIFKAK